MYKKLDHRLIKSNRSYKVADISKLLKVGKPAVRDWVTYEKLEAFYDGKTILIYGPVLKQHIIRKNSRKKRKLKFNEFKCLNCQSITEPVDKKIVELTLSNNSKAIRALSVCPICDHDYYRIYSLKYYPQITETFNILSDDVGRLYDSSSAPSKTNIEDINKTSPSESLFEPSEIPLSEDNQHQQTNLLENL